MAHSPLMDTDELIDRLNTLQAQHIALMHLLASVIRHTGADVRVTLDAPRSRVGFGSTVLIIATVVNGRASCAVKSLGSRSPRS